MSNKQTKAPAKQIVAIDLFCGIGGLTHGLVKAGINVVAGIDNDSLCKYGYEKNNPAKFIDKDIKEVSSEELSQLYGSNGPIKVLVGCAPCQPFSKLTRSKSPGAEIEPLMKFAQLIVELKPDIVSMENVSGLADEEKYPVFRAFIDTLVNNGYEYSYEIVDTSEYGIPQTRKRLVLLASRLGKIALVPRTHEGNKVSVREAIGDLDPIEHGEVSKKDPLHRARKLSDLNLLRIKSTPEDGGNSSSWKKDLVLDCHKKETGKTYRHSVYGRMRWDDPAPTMTTQCIGLGNGRFGHPEQDRAISLREAAILQTFPDDYQFLDPSSPIVMKYVAKFIGNAVPVRLGSVIGESIKAHLEEYGS